MGSIVGKFTVRALGTQTRSVDSVETGFTGRTDFVVVRCSATNSVLPSCCLFHFQGNATRVIRARESTVNHH
jgi:hypothetical protein